MKPKVKIKTQQLKGELFDDLLQAVVMAMKVKGHALLNSTNRLNSLQWDENNLNDWVYKNLTKYHIVNSFVHPILGTVSGMTWELRITPEWTPTTGLLYHTINAKYAVAANALEYYVYFEGVLMASDSTGVINDWRSIRDKA